MSWGMLGSVHIGQGVGIAPGQGASPPGLVGQHHVPLPRAASEMLGMGHPQPKKKWSEVCERVQQPDGSVRTSPPFKSAATSAGISPPRPHQAGGTQGGLGFPRQSRGRGGLLNAPSRGGSSRGGSSGKSSRSSSRDMARDGDISSRCSSGCWETSTNSSEPSRARSPPDAALSPFAKGLMMPDPIRTGFILYPALLADEHAAEITRELVNPGEDAGTHPSEVGATANNLVLAEEVTPGLQLKRDPFGRDGAHRSDKPCASVNQLSKYVKDVAQQVDTNLRDGRMPTVEKLDAFVSRLVGHLQQHLKQVPRRARLPLEAQITKKFQKFWNFQRNEKVKASNNISVEELNKALICLVEALESDAHHDMPLAQPRPLRLCPAAQFPRGDLGG